MLDGVQLTLQQHRFELRVHLYMDFLTKFVLHDPELVTWIVDTQLWMWRADCKVICGFSTV